MVEKQDMCSDISKMDLKAVCISKNDGMCQKKESLFALELMDF